MKADHGSYFRNYIHRMQTNMEKRRKELRKRKEKEKKKELLEKYTERKKIKTI